MGGQKQQSRRFLDRKGARGVGEALMALSTTGVPFDKESLLALRSGLSDNLLGMSRTGLAESELSNLQRQLKEIETGGAGAQSQISERVSSESSKRGLSGISPEIQSQAMEESGLEDFRLRGGAAVQGFRGGLERQGLLSGGQLRESAIENQLRLEQLLSGLDVRERELMLQSLGAAGGLFGRSPGSTPRVGGTGSTLGGIAGTAIGAFYGGGAAGAGVGGSIGSSVGGLFD